MRTKHFVVAISLGLGLTLASLLVLVGAQMPAASAALPAADDPIVGLTAVSDSPTRLRSATTFTAAIVSGTNVSYTWHFGDGASLNGQVVTHTYSQTGVFLATVIASNAITPYVALASTSVTVDVPVTALTVTNDSPTPLGRSTLFTPTVAGTVADPQPSNVVYDWAFGDGTFARSTSATETHPYLAVGVYTAVITASNSVSSITATSQVTIVDSPIVTLTATNDGPTGLGSLTTLSAVVTGSVMLPPPSNVSYSWDLGDGTTGTGALVTHIYPAMGVYTAVVTASNSVSSRTATTTVRIVEAPLAGLSASNDSPTLLGRSTKLTATAVVTVGTVTLPAGDNVTYDWDFGDDTGPVQIATSPSGIGLKIPDNGCSSNDYLTSTVQVITAGFIADMQVEIYDLRHMFDADVNLYLLGPDGTQIALSTGNGGTGDDYYQTIFSDRASTPITSGTPPFTGHFRPEQPLVSFAHKSQQGDWTLRVCDNGPGDVGTLNKWGLTIMSTIPSAPNVITHTYPALGVYTATVTARNLTQSLMASTVVNIVSSLRIYLPLIVK